ncbi:MAG: hypothetical protein EAZ89_14365 [Bacteroidetes bacterium]|nr:MAG: hypothetical protein EAZ89_14365 [Bacteroidota bacterium]
MSDVKLKTRHLLIAGPVAAQAFGEAAQVYVHYVAGQELLLAPMDHESFSKSYKSALQMLKTRNLQGDKSISLQEILIDHDLSDEDRDLSFTYDAPARVLHVIL